ncbi:MAG: hypothetical protein ACRELE_06000 [Gemmatimonadales bacterium]
MQNLHYIAEGFYRTLLDEQFAEGFIPDEVGDIAAICRCPVEVMQQHWPSLEGFFPFNEFGVRANVNQEENRTEIDRKRISNSLAGKASAKAKLKERSTPVQHVSTNVQPEEKRREEKRVSETTSPHPDKSGIVEKHPDLLIYEQYPRKEGKRGALKAIGNATRRLCKGEVELPPMTLREARVLLYRNTQAYARSPAGSNPDPTKIPHPATWFNQSRYLDDQANWQHTGGSNGKFSNYAAKSDSTVDAVKQAIQAGRDRNSTRQTGGDAASDGVIDRPAGLLGEPGRV